MRFSVGQLLILVGEGLLHASCMYLWFKGKFEFVSNICWGFFLNIFSTVLFLII